MKKIRNSEAITLIALVVTIIVLIILAGVSINMVLGENGIISRAKEASSTYSEGQAKERLEMILANLQTEKILNKDYNENEFINNYLEEQGILVEGDIVLVDNYQFEIDRNALKIVQSLGILSKEELKKPAVTKLQITVGYTEISVLIGIRNSDTTNTICILKKVETGEEIEKTENLEYKFNNLEMGKEYEIIVEASNEYGNAIKKTVVTTKKPILVSNIVLNEIDTQICINKTKQLTYTIEPNDAADKTVIWETSNSSIATVENGLITPVASGECVITCRSNDGGATSTCKVSIINVNGISTVADLKAIENNLSGNYVLLKDIVLDETWTSIATGANIYFTGTLDGNGYSIKNLDNSLFGKIKNATIKNIKFEVVNASGGIVSDTSYYKNTISNVGVVGNTILGNRVGGLIGYVAQTKAGVGDPIVISNCYVRSNIGDSSSTYAGHLIGSLSVGSRATVNNCYYSGTITTGRYSTLIDGTDCYYETDIHTDGTVIGLTKEEFADSTNFTNWDFENTWIIKDGYPELKIFIK